MIVNDFFTFNNIGFDKAYKITIGARGGARMFFLEQLCIKQLKEINRLKAENKRLSDDISRLFEASASLANETASLLDLLNKEDENEFKRNV